MQLIPVKFEGIIIHVWKSRAIHTSGNVIMTNLSQPNTLLNFQDRRIFIIGSFWSKLVVNGLHRNIYSSDFNTREFHRSSWGPLQTLW